MLEPEMILFLMEIGRWAKDRLNQIWSIKNKEQVIPLSQKEQIEAVLPTLAQSLSETKSDEEIDAIQELIRSKRNLILVWLQESIDDQKALALAQLGYATLQARERERNKNIKRVLKEIDADLGALGIFIQKVPS